MTIPSMTAGAAPERVAEALNDAGCVVISGLLDEPGRNSVISELAPCMEEVRVVEDDDPTQFYRGRTRRTSALVARSAPVGKLVLDDNTLDLCDRLLTPNGEFGYQLHVSGTLHGAGANVSGDWRYGVILTYSLGWLRQEENQYLDVPVEVARNLSPQLRDIIGYKMYRALGFSMNRDLGTIPD